MHYIKKLSLEDLDIVEDLDKLSGGYMVEQIESDSIENYNAYGVFVRNDDCISRLIGYCSIESAEALSSSTYWNPNSVTITHFFVKEEYRDKGYGTELLEYVLHEIPETKTIFANTEYECKAEWYKKFGFIEVADGSILRPEKIEE